MRNVVEDGSKQIVIAHTVVEHVYETGYVTTIGDVEPTLLHLELLAVAWPGTIVVRSTPHVVALEQELPRRRDCSSATTRARAPSMIERS